MFCLFHPFPLIWRCLGVAPSCFPKMFFWYPLALGTPNSAGVGLWLDGLVIRLRRTALRRWWWCWGWWWRWRWWRRSSVGRLQGVLKHEGFGRHSFVPRTLSNRERWEGSWVWMEIQSSFGEMCPEMKFLSGKWTKGVILVQVFNPYTL